MAKKEGYLTSLTREEINNIQYYAPSKVGLSNDKYQDDNLINLHSIQDIYDEYGKVMKSEDTTSLEKRNWVLYKKKADNILLEEVELLSKKLIDAMLTSGKKETKEIRNRLKEVLNYQDELEDLVERNNREVITYGEGQGYLLFRDWTDEEIEHFWNG